MRFLPLRGSGLLWVSPDWWVVAFEVLPETFWAPMTLTGGVIVLERLLCFPIPNLTESLFSSQERGFNILVWPP